MQTRTTPTMGAMGAKLRARRRAESAGAIIFIVAMTLAVLASLGLYAMQASSTEMKSSGFGRQSTQTQYIAEYGMLGATQLLSADAIGTYVRKAKATPEATCSALPNIPSTASEASKACARLWPSEISGGWSTATLTSYATPSTASLGPIPRKGDFYVEITDPLEAPPPAGYDRSKKGLMFLQVTLTVTGRTSPYLTGAAASNKTAEYGGTTVIVGRSRITGGPTAW